MTPREANPYLIIGPALISFSGGRTSAYMLHEILRAHGGTLPPDVVVAFANTGKERDETLRFVDECGSRWGVKINWIEWRHGQPGFETVGPNGASRQGEPFKALIRSKKRLPNGRERWCTEYLKVRPMFALMRALTGLEPGQYLEAIGLRDDEGMRILRGMENAEKHGRKTIYPLAKAKVRKAHVEAFWDRQPFHLDLERWEGNCDFCFLKGRGIRKRIAQDAPSITAWWSNLEVETGGQFDNRDSVAGLVEEVRRAPSLFARIDDEYDVECGLTCAGEAA